MKLPGEKRKQTFYLTATTIDEIQLEAARLDRSASWVVCLAWKLGRRGMLAMPYAGQEGLASRSHPVAGAEEP